MKHTTFHLGFFLTPLIPIAVYLRTAGAMYDSYSVSIIFGVYAFILVCNQFYLASQPVWLTKLLGAKAVRALHSSSPLLILLLSLVHASLKLSNGFTLSTTQALLGLAAFILFFVGTMAALFFFANTLLTKHKAFASLRTKTYERTGLTYQRARAMHNLMVVAGLVVLLHVLRASTSSFSYNPWGMSILMAWMAFSLLSYLNYRLKGRTHRGKS
ncbi:MAG TPA: hypothetical protein VJ869_10430 [Sphaerochaeta sp.]|jgi:predicted ferric reductase|nr:hypothetical protein [Spirochaetia bacterium]NCC91119.1 hypothetical protein [Spirochaetia bacterium]HKM07397.1 hypothetical protein [Sphaerochaeta sp.]